MSTSLPNSRCYFELVKGQGHKLRKAWTRNVLYMGVIKLQERPPTVSAIGAACLFCFSTISSHVVLIYVSASQFDDRLTNNSRDKK